MARNEADLFKKVFKFLDVDEDFTPKPSARFENLSVMDPMVQIRAREHFRDRFDLVLPPDLPGGLYRVYAGWRQPPGAYLPTGEEPGLPLGEIFIAE